jgi:sarcosine oxidase
VTYDIIIAGLGAMGSATAYHLAGRGARVLGLDRYHPPHILGSTHGGSRVIRETAFEHPQYVPLARLAYRQWRLMEQALGEPLLHVTGGLYLGAAGSQVVAGTRTSALAHGVSHEDLDAAEVARRFPLFANLDGASGLFEPGAGWLAPERIVAACLRYAGDHGVELRFDEPVLRWQSHADGVVVETGQGRYRAGQLLLAAGPWLPQLLGPLGWGLSVERVTQHWFTPSHDAASFDRLPIFIWETPHEVFYGFPRIDGAVKVAVHHGGERTTPETVRREVSAGEIEATRTILRRHLPALDGAHQRSAVCLYTNSVDGHFVIDHHPALQRVLIASPCSGFGFKFAAAIGAMLADLLTQRAPEIDLATFRLRW